MQPQQNQLEAPNNNVAPITMMEQQPILISPTNVTPGGFPVAQPQQQQQQGPGGLVQQPLPSSQRAPVVTRKVESKGKNAFVSGLSKSVTDQDLAKMFVQFGSVQQTYILTEVNTGASRGLGFVHFDDPQCVLDAIAAMDGKQVSHTGNPEDATTISVRVAFDDALFSPEETNKLFVRNVPPHVRTSDLAQHFAQFGKVLECSIHKDISAKGRAENTAHHMAYITFQSIPEANKALHAAHKTQPFNNGAPGIKPLHIKRAESLQCRNIRLRKGNQPPGAQPQNVVSPVQVQQPVQLMTAAGMSVTGASDSITSNGSSWGSSAFGQTIGSMYGNSSTANQQMLAPNMYPGMQIPQAMAQPGQPVLLAPNGTQPLMMMPQGGMAQAGGQPTMLLPTGVGQQPMMAPNGQQVVYLVNPAAQPQQHQQQQ